MRRGAALPALALALGLAAPAAAEPRLQDVLSAATLSFGDDGAIDRAVLTQGQDGADLAIFRGVPAPGPEAPAMKPAFAKAGLVFAGQAWGTMPSLSVNGRGALVIASQNDSIGRDRWHMTLTVAFRDGQYRVIGLTRDARDTLDPAAGSRCDLNLATGKGTANGRPVTGLAPIPLADWSDAKIPKACGG